MSFSPPPSSPLDQLGEFFALLSDWDHLKLLCSLYQAPKTAAAIATELNLPPAQVTQILSKLVQASVIVRNISDLEIQYEIRDPAVQDLCRLVLDSLAREA